MPPVLDILTRYQTFTPTTEEQQFLSKLYKDFEADRSLKEEGQPIMSNRKLQTFWDESQRDYLQYLLEDTND